MLSSTGRSISWNRTNWRRCQLLGSHWDENDTRQFHLSAKLPGELPKGQLQVQAGPGPNSGPLGLFRKSHLSWIRMEKEASGASSVLPT